MFFTVAEHGGSRHKKIKRDDNDEEREEFTERETAGMKREYLDT